MRFLRWGWFMFGVSLGLESMRRTFIGGSSLSLFIIKEFGLDRQAAPTLAYLRRYLEIEGELIAKIPKITRFLIMPWQDHHDAGMTFLQILGIVAEAQRPPDCAFYWKKAK